MIKVSKITLTNSLKKVVAFIPKIKTSETSGTVTLTMDGEDLKLILSYPEASMETSCHVVETDGSDAPAAVSGSKFLSMVSVADKEINLTSADGTLELVSGKYKWREPMPSVVNKSITLPSKPVATFNVYPILTAFNTVKYAIDSESVRPSLFMIDVVDGRVRACNGFQYHEVDTKIQDLTFSIPGGLVDGFISVLRYFDGDVDLYSDDANFYFRNGSDTISVRKLQLGFPDLDRLLVRPLRSAVPALLQVRKSDLVKALRQVRRVADDNYPYVELHLTQKEVLLRCTSKMGSDVVSQIEGKWAAKPRVATFNVRHLANTIDSLHDGVIEIRFGADTKTKKSPLVVEGVGTWTMLNQMNLATRN